MSIQRDDMMDEEDNDIEQCLRCGFRTNKDKMYQLKTWDGLIWLCETCIENYIEI